MRVVSVVFVLGLVVLVAAGCNSTRWGFLHHDDKDKLAKPDNGKAPTVAALVDYMNDNAGRIKSVQCNSLEVTCAQGVERINLHGKMVAEKPRGFRMSLDGPLGFSQVADLGSNSDEFWFWIKPQPGQKMQSYQYYCSYKDLEKGVGFIPIPFQPDWIMEAMGLGPYGPADRYQIETDDKTQTIRLIEKSRSPQGTPVRKVIVMHRREKKAPEPQITHFILIDDTTNQEICSAHIQQTMVDKATGAILPRKLDLNWRQENATLSLVMDRTAVNVAVPPRAFVRTPLNGVQSYNLALRQPDSGVQAIQGFGPK
jgi:hypothetical protein